MAEGVFARCARYDNTTPLRDSHGKMDLPLRASPFRAAALAIGALVVLGGGVLAAPKPAFAQTAEIAEVIDGDTVVLSAGFDGAREVRLVGIQAPKLPLGRARFRSWPLADEAQAALAGLARGRRVTVVVTGRARDRHGRLLAHLERDDGLWLQGEMLRLGLARVYTFADNRGRIEEMLLIERRARAEAVGIWRHPFYRIRAADAIADSEIGTFQLVEGTIAAVERVKSRVYLNFGADWRTDFTAIVDAKAISLFAGSGLDPLALRGFRVRVRGWLDRYNGPLIELSHPEQIEVLGAAQP
jgi:endonuclease YncB( thermonuclease family)